MNKQHRTKRNSDYALVAIVCALCLTGLEIMALMKGIDGQLFALVIAAIAGLGGFNLGSFFSSNGKRTKKR